MFSPLTSPVKSQPGSIRFNCLGSFVSYIADKYNEMKDEKKESVRSKDLESFLDVMESIDSDGSVTDGTTPGIFNYDTVVLAKVIKDARNDLRVMIPPEQIQQSTIKAVKTIQKNGVNWYPKGSVDIRDENGVPGSGDDGGGVFAVAPWKAFKTGALKPVRGKKWYHALKANDDYNCLRYPIDEITMEDVGLEKYPPGNCEGFHFEGSRQCRCIPSIELTMAWANKKGIDWMDVDYDTSELVDMNFASRYNGHLYSSPKEDYDEIEACLEALDDKKSIVITENLS